MGPSLVPGCALSLRAAARVVIDNTLDHSVDVTNTPDVNVLRSEVPLTVAQFYLMMLRLSQREGQSAIPLHAQRRDAEIMVVFFSTCPSRCWDSEMTGT